HSCRQNDSSEDWLEGLDAAVSRCAEPPVLVAHSLGCMLVAHWASHNRGQQIAGALLVAPADVDSDERTPAETRAFAPVPLDLLPFPAIVAASTNDPYVDLNRAKTFATAWGAGFVNLGPLAHVNCDSHLDTWDDGWNLLKDLGQAQQVRALG
ncbi:RBBP9/YdeN family alpha/beta hydrolase, partial [Pseudomonadota bacterium]